MRANVRMNCKRFKSEVHSNHITIEDQMENSFTVINERKKCKPRHESVINSFSGNENEFIHKTENNCISNGEVREVVNESLNYKPKYFIRCHCKQNGSHSYYFVIIYKFIKKYN